MKRIRILGLATLAVLAWGRTTAREADREPDVPFIPTPPNVVERMLELAEVKKGDVVYDLGCGDGRIVVAAAKNHGARAVGFDIDPQRVKDAQENARINNVTDRVTIKEADIFTLDLSGANVITLYLLPELNVRLIPQLKKLKPGCRIVSHAFGMRGIKPAKVETVRLPGGVERLVYLWVTPLVKEKR
jgi:SAM-dependent methyltransferase